MKDYLRQIVASIQDNARARLVVREYVQARLLESLQDGGAFAHWAFVGGTALRFLYSMRRFSEDLDFSLVRAGVADDFETLMAKAKRTFLSEDYTVSVKVKAARTVKSAMVRFEGLLAELNLSPHRSETISVKVEIDTNPPEGATFETSVVRRHCLLNLQHYDKASLLAGKLHALLTRRYVKGRDVYDLLWYLSDRTWPEPNMVLLNNALAQTGWSGPRLNSDNWRRETARHVRGYDFDKAAADAGPFLERPEDLALLTRENLLRLLGERL